MAQDIDQNIAVALGFPKPHYRIIERERRWVCRSIPRDFVATTETITDLYVAGSQLRLREARPVQGGPSMLRLTRKADVDAQTRLISSIYLAEAEFALLATALQGARIKKLRHRLKPFSGVVMAIDEFKGDLEGLLLVEAEFDTPEALEKFSPPDFVGHEVTNDLRFTGWQLAMNGPPK